MTDPLLTLLATIERLDAAATAPPWLTGRTQDPMVGNFYFDRHCVDGSSPIEGHGGPGALGTAIGVTHSPDDAQIVAFSRNAIAPLASMLRAAVEALDVLAFAHKNDPKDSDEVRWMRARARAALATIRRMAAETKE